MFGIGMPEMILILALGLIVIGPKKLPDLAKSMGRAFREFKKATTEIKDSIGIDNELQEVKNSLNEINAEIKESIDLAPVEALFEARRIYLATALETIDQEYGSLQRYIREGLGLSLEAQKAFQASLLE